MTVKAANLTRGGSRNSIADNVMPVNGLLIVTLILLALGLMMMTSASIEISSSQFGDPLFHLKRQAIFVVLGIATILTTISIPIRRWYTYSGHFLLLSYGLLILVLIPGVGKVVNGSARWIDLGLFDLQPSEMAKVFIVLYLAAFLQRNRAEVQEKWSGFIKPMFVIAAAVALLHYEPDHGAMVILITTAFSMVFLAGAKLYRFVLVAMTCVTAVVVLAIKYPYVLRRFASFQDPWAEEYVYGSGYQLTQALIAFGRGEWFGVGLGNSIQKLYFLPEAHTDFVLAIIAEELGLIGVMVVIGLFCFLVYKSLLIGKVAEQQGRLFSAYFAYGLAIVFASQILINIGVNIGLLPTKGLTLPFLSYGGASLLVSCFMVALLMRIQYECENKLPEL